MGGRSSKSIVSLFFWLERDLVAVISSDPVAMIFNCEVVTIVALVELRGEREHQHVEMIAVVNY